LNTQAFLGNPESFVASSGRTAGRPGNHGRIWARIEQALEMGDDVIDTLGGPFTAARPKSESDTELLGQLANRSADVDPLVDSDNRAARTAVDSVELKVGAFDSNFLKLK
jgi:hypothetical protein